MIAKCCFIFLHRNSDCGWNITTTSNQSVEVVVYFLDIDDSDDCLNRRLEINTNGTYVLMFVSGPSWSCSYGSWIYNYLCNQCLSQLLL